MKRTFISALLVPAGAWLLAAAATAADPATPHRLVIRADQPGPVIDLNIFNRHAARVRTVCNLDPRQPASISVEVAGKAVQSAAGRVLTADTIQAHNTFDNPDQVQPTPLTGIQPQAAGFQVTLPPRSVSVVTIL